jgi:hypothetical protein
MVQGMQQYLAIHSFPALQGRLKRHMNDYQLKSCTPWLSESLKLRRKEERNLRYATNMTTSPSTLHKLPVISFRLPQRAFELFLPICHCIMVATQAKTSFAGPLGITRVFKQAIKPKGLIACIVQTTSPVGRLN